MGLKTDKLGKYIEVFDLRNTEENYGEESVVGISTQKTIINTKANLSGVSLSSYKIFLPGQFAYVSDTSRRGDKVSLVYNSTEKTYLVSSITTVFYVKDIQSLLPDYLFMYFNRAEFDRYARFNSWGSAREVFSWEDMCDIDIELPDIEVQRKYVNIYKAMVANQQSYERGLEDLKLVCDGYIEELKRAIPSEKIGKYIQRWDERNEQNIIKNVRGISTLKQFREPTSKVNKEKLSNYKICRPRQFAFVQTTHNEKVFAYAFNNTGKSIVVSSVNEVFFTYENKLYPEFLSMFFNRKEFDRYVRFHSWGSAREIFAWNDLTEVAIPIPDIKVQKAISNIYKVYTQRKCINEQLKVQIKNICPILIRDSLENGG